MNPLATPDPDENAEAPARGRSGPPFMFSSWAGLAYVCGDYNPPSRDKSRNDQSDFLGIYVSKEDPGLSLMSFDRNGQQIAFHRCGDADASAAFAMIDAFLHYEIPFVQWIMIPVGDSEKQLLDSAGLTEAYERARKQVGEVLYQARLLIRASRPVLEPMFIIATRSVEEIREDRATFEAVWIAVVGEEKARRYFENNAKLAEMRKRGR